MESLTSKANYLAGAILAITGRECFVLLSKTGGKGLPIVT